MKRPLPPLNSSRLHLTQVTVARPKKARTTNASEDPGKAHALFPTGRSVSWHGHIEISVAVFPQSTIWSSYTTVEHIPVHS